MTILSIDLDQENLALVRNDVSIMYGDEYMKERTFDDFFGDVDTDNTYEEEWNPEVWKPYYEQIWREAQEK